MIPPIIPTTAITTSAVPPPVIPQQQTPLTTASDSSRIAMLEAEVVSLKSRLEDHTQFLQHMAQCNDLPIINNFTS